MEVIEVREEGKALARCQALVRRGDEERPCRGLLTWIRGGYGLCSAHARSQVVRVPADAVRLAA